MLMNQTHSSLSYHYYILTSLPPREYFACMISLLHTGLWMFRPDQVYLVGWLIYTIEQLKRFLLMTNVCPKNLSQSKLIYRDTGRYLTGKWTCFQGQGEVGTTLGR